MNQLIPIWQFKYFKLDFLYPFLGYSPEAVKILLGGCNYKCVYCKRSKLGEFSGINYVTMKEILNEVDKAIAKNCFIEVSGGEVCIFPKETLTILTHAKLKDAHTVIATNGSFPARVQKYAKYCDAVKIDIKGPKRYVKKLTGIDYKDSENTLESIGIINKIKNIILNIKVPFFGFTTEKDIKEITKKIKDVAILRPNMLFTLRGFTPLEYTSQWLTPPDVDIGKKILEKFQNMLKPVKISFVYDDSNNKEHQLFLENKSWIEFSKGISQPKR